MKLAEKLDFIDSLMDSVKRSTAVWPDATIEQLQSEMALKARLPELMERFRTMVESLGFTY